MTELINQERIVDLRETAHAEFDNTNVRKISYLSPMRKGLP